ncbi:TPA: transketolase [Candidatus Dependentiae bacterium]|nr:MAG: Transketolase [candidate division TM6 bacterium GW2011_GWF2_43_87]HBL98394.1 transketolase [Candidatus Dependentiae bacterium]
MKSILELQKRALALRIDCVRATTAAESGHPTSCLSAADLVAALFFHAMRFEPDNHNNPCNDRFILSKGHAAPLLYAAWKQLGKLSDSQLLELRTFNSPLEGHPTTRFAYTEAATGSLGQGLSIGAGMALAAKKDALPYRTFVLLGDSEMTEGSNWEAAEIASFYKLNNLIALVDINNLGQRGITIEALENLSGNPTDAFVKKFEAFGWNTIPVDGHDIQALVKALDKASKLASAQPSRPTVLLAKTIKGYGLNTDIENKNGFHGKALSHEKLNFYLRKLLDRFAETTGQRGSLVLSLPHYNPQKPCTTPTPSQKKTPSIKPPSYIVGEKYATRAAYGQALAVLGADERIICLDAEVKNSTYATTFENQYPDRFIECFIAEQNMIGMAVGLARRGKIPFASTFASFLTRAFDQIRMAGIGRAPLRLVGSHAGVSIGQDGPSQMGLEDLAMIRTIPESIILYPCDAVSTTACVKLMRDYNNGISYLRTTRSETPVLYKHNHPFALGECATLRSSPKDVVCIVAAGITVFEALKAYDLLAREGIAARIIDCYCIKPLPTKALQKALSQCKGRLVTVEDHYREGGMGEAIVYEVRNTIEKATCLAVAKLPRSGQPDELMAYEHIDASAILDAAKEVI